MAARCYKMALGEYMCGKVENVGLGALFRELSGRRADDADCPASEREQPARTADASEHVRIRFRFVGTVQAVGFRWTTTNLAKQCGATGWVRNEDDGSVTAEIQGAPDRVEYVIDGLDQYYNGSTWSGGFQLAAREYLPLVKGEDTFRVVF